MLRGVLRRYGATLRARRAGAVAVGSFRRRIALSDVWMANLSWLEPDLAVGGSFPCGVAARLASEHGLGAVIDLREETCDDAGEMAACGLAFLHLPTPDMMAVNQAMLDEGVEFAARSRREGLKTLIHCEHGIGRSALLALCVLVDRGLAPLDALLLAKNARAALSPSEAQFRAWTTWIKRRSGARPPAFDEFALIAYRHLARSA